MDIETDATVRADETEFIRLLENLFRNSIEHAASDVTISIERIPDGFAVTDDGPGIDDAYRDQVFESGFSTAEDGTGYGLDIVERVAAAHGWDVELAESDAGARFEFTSVEFVEESRRRAGGDEA